MTVRRFAAARSAILRATRGVILKLEEDGASLLGTKWGDIGRIDMHKFVGI
jgi:hypothetical protein